MTRLLAAAALIVALLAPPAAAADPISTWTAAAWINAERNTAGLAPLTVDAAAWAGDTQTWANHLAANRTCAHAPASSRWANPPRSDRPIAENVACWSSWTWTDIQTAMMRSPSHRANVLCDCTTLAVGLGRTSTGGNYLVLRFQ